MALTLDPMPQIWGITGNLGGGKSLTAVNLAVTSMAKGYFVCSNILLNIDAIAREYGEYVRRLYLHFDFDDPNFHPQNLPCGSPRGTRNPRRVLVIMDECAEWVDQYTTAKDPRIKQFWSWLRHTSKQNQDVILIVQRLEYLNKVLRLLISKWLIVDDLRVWRIPVFKCRLPFMGGYVMQRVFDRTKHLVQGPCLCSKSVWGKYYDTAQCLNTQVAEARSQYRQPVILQNFYTLLFYVLASIFVFFVLVSLSDQADERDEFRKQIAPYVAN